jgi:hypothetical protein
MINHAVANSALSTTIHPLQHTIMRLWKNYFEANSLSFYFGEMKEN